MHAAGSLKSSSKIEMSQEGREHTPPPGIPPTKTTTASGRTGHTGAQAERDRYLDKLSRDKLFIAGTALSQDRDEFSIEKQRWKVRYCMSRSLRGPHSLMIGSAVRVEQRQRRSGREMLYFLGEFKISRSCLLKAHRRP